MPKLIDGFLYHNEIELLRLRLQLLAPHVERFVVVWSSETFTGTMKEEGFPHDDPVVAAHRDKIELVTIDKLPPGTARARDSYSRDVLARGFESAAPDDLLIVSDIDEIPRPEVLERLRASAPDGPRILAQDYYNFKFDYQLVHGMQAVWPGSIVCSKRAFTTPQALRAARWNHMYEPGLCIPDAGWHFSFLTHGADVADKLSVYLHQDRGVQARKDADVTALLAARHGFHDHLEPCSVWAVVDLASYRCPELAALVRGFPTLLCGTPDDEAEVRRRIKLSSYRMKADELMKILPWFSTAELAREVLRRMTSKISG